MPTKKWMNHPWLPISHLKTAKIIWFPLSCHRQLKWIWGIQNAYKALALPVGSGSVVH